MDLLCSQVFPFCCLSSHFLCCLFFFSKKWQVLRWRQTVQRVTVRNSPGCSPQLLQWGTVSYRSVLSGESCFLQRGQRRRKRHSLRNIFISRLMHIYCSSNSVCGIGSKQSAAAMFMELGTKNRAISVAVSFTDVVMINFGPLCVQTLAT